MGHAIAGSTGSAISNLATYPLDLIITRLQVQRHLQKDTDKSAEDEYNGFQDAVQKIYDNEGGWKGLYAGLASDTGKTIADSFLFFLTYNFLRQKRIAAHAGNLKSLPALDELAVGFLAGASTKLLTSPIANVVTRVQTAGLRSSAPDQQEKIQDETRSAPSARAVAQKILKEKGVRGFWSGYSASLVLTLNPTFTFFLFETMKRLLPRSSRDNPPAILTFLMAAISKSAASIVMYPFSLAKARAQAGGRSEQKREIETLEKDVNDTAGNETTHKAESKAARSTIFSTLLTIYQTEGPSALYEGLELEILKGFLSHGITMLVKQAIHRFVVRLYFALSIVRRKYQQKSSALNLAENARQRSVEYYDLARARAEEKLFPVAKMASKGGSEALEGFTNMQKSIGEKANETAELVAEYVEEEGEQWRDLYGTGLAKWFDEK